MLKKGDLVDVRYSYWHGDRRIDFWEFVGRVIGIRDGWDKVEKIYNIAQLGGEDEDCWIGASRLRLSVNPPID